MPSNRGSRQRKALEAWAFEQLRNSQQFIIGSATLEEIECDAILWALVWERGSVPRTAIRLGTSLQTIYTRLKDWGFVYSKRTP